MVTMEETKGSTPLCFQRLCYQIFSAEKILDKLPKNRRDIQQKMAVRVQALRGSKSDLLAQTGA